MNKISWLVIALVIAAGAVMFFGWRYWGWFQSLGGVGIRETEFDLVRQEQIDKTTQDDIELRREVEDARIALEAYGFATQTVPASLTDLVPDYLNEVPVHVKYDRLTDTQAMVSAALSENQRQTMADDDGTDAARYELKIEIYKTDNVSQPQ